MEAQLDLANRKLRCTTISNDDVFKKPNAISLTTSQAKTHTVTRMKKETTFDAKLGEIMLSLTTPWSPQI